MRWWLLSLAIALLAALVIFVAGLELGAALDRLDPRWPL